MSDDVDVAQQSEEDHVGKTISQRLFFRILITSFISLKKLNRQKFKKECLDAGEKTRNELLS